jgi:RNase adapter protein RapZ
MALQLVVVTGMSGAGRSTALRALEDLGHFCVDNIPPALIPQLIELLEKGGELPRVAIGVDVRTGGFLEGATRVLDGLTAGGHHVELLFLESQDNELVRRFSETRRAHPLAPGGNLLAAIQRERERVAPLRARAGLIIDTTGLSVHDLRRSLVEYIARGGARARMVTRVVSFGYKYGLPVDADLVFDLRYLPNPHFVAELKPLTGLDEAVTQFVFAAPESQELLTDLTQLLSKLLPRYEREGKAYLTICIGCTGGQHRSVAMAEALAAQLRSLGEVMVEHRDIQRRPR